jgi:predicted nucleic acid-binding protein
VAEVAGDRSPISKGITDVKRWADRESSSPEASGTSSEEFNAGVNAMYLLDTNVVSELRKPRPHGAVLAWIDSVANGDLHLSAVTLGEIQAGIEITREQDSAKADEIESWAELVAGSYNVLPMDGPAFRLWARLMHRVSETFYEDAMIAATAITHGLTIVTRDTSDFANFKVTVFNPFGSPKKK